MPSFRGTTRIRDVFPQTFAAWLRLRGVTRRTSNAVMRPILAPSPWSMAVVAGSLALFLTILLVFVEPPPDAAVSSRAPQSLLTASPDGSADRKVDVTLERLIVPAGWQAPLEETWVSQPSAPFSSALAAFGPETWRPAAPSAIAATAAAQFEPYYLRAEFVDLAERNGGVASRDEPSPRSPCRASRHLAVTVDRGPAETIEQGRVRYSLRVCNNGAEQVEDVTLSESVPGAERIIDVSPPAAMTPEGQLVWTLAALAPAEQRDFAVTLRAGDAQPIATVAALSIGSQITVSTFVAGEAPPAELEESVFPELALPDSDAASPFPPFNRTATTMAQLDDDEPLLPEFEPSPAEPAEAAPPIPPVYERPLLEEELEHVVESVPSAAFPDEPAWTPTPRPLPLDPARVPQPLLSVTATAPPAVRTGDVLTTIFEVVNSGDAAATDVVLTVHLDPSLRHKKGETVEHYIERLEPSETRRARLLSRAIAVGDGTLDAVLSYEGLAADTQAYTVQIIPANAVPNGPAHGPAQRSAPSGGPIPRAAPSDPDEPIIRPAPQYPRPQQYRPAPTAAPEIHPETPAADEPATAPAPESGPRPAPELGEPDFALPVHPEAETPPADDKLLGTPH